MERQAKIGVGAFKIIGLVYTLLGGIFFVLGIVLWNVLTEGDEALTGMIFTGIGSVFLLLGIAFLFAEHQKQKRANVLLAAGRYVLGEVVDLTFNVNVTINNRHPYVVLVRCLDDRGRIHIYRSPNVRGYVDRSIIGKAVRVYTEYIGSKEYYVDLEGVLPQVIEH